MSDSYKQLYKNGIDTVANQEERRRLLLEKQKFERQNTQDQYRCLQEILDKPNKTRGKKSSLWQKKQQERTERSFQETYGVELGLQLSEWMQEKPENMGDWFLVPCPKGRRNMVVAHNGHTAVYNKIGNCVSIFRSMLPGDGTETEALTILDCIYVRESDAFYVLDVLAFGQQNLLNCEAEFRFFWLRSKWDELEFLEKRSATNRKPFYLVKQYDFECSLQIAEVLQNYPIWLDNKPQLDGFLFYHRFASYTCGKTPLVGWLFAFMVPDILGFSVSELYTKPPDYGDPLAYMDLFNKRLQIKRQKKVKSRDYRDNWVDIKENRRNTFQASDAFVCSTMEQDDKEAEFDERDTLERLFEAERALEMENGEEVVEDIKAVEVEESI